MILAYKYVKSTSIRAYKYKLRITFQHTKYRSMDLRITVGAAAGMQIQDPGLGSCASGGCVYMRPSSNSNKFAKGVRNIPKV